MVLIKTNLSINSVQFLKLSQISPSSILFKSFICKHSPKWYHIPFFPEKQKNINKMLQFKVGHVLSMRWRGLYYKTFCGSNFCRTVCHYQSRPPQSSICKQGWSLPGWSPLRYSTAIVDSHLCQQIADQGRSVKITAYLD